MTDIAPGRYAMTGPDGQFEARCGMGGCTNRIVAHWGASGCAYAPTILRKYGWEMSGLTSRAIWFCPDHPPGPPITRGSPPYWPYREHRNMRQVMRDEARERFLQLPPKDRANRHIEDFEG